MVLISANQHIMKTALITGGNKGIGFEIARQLGSKGFQVLIGARSEGRMKTAVKQLQDECISAFGINIDVSNQPSI
jgi:short-subunit dehydrogenase